MSLKKPLIVVKYPEGIGENILRQLHDLKISMGESLEANVVLLHDTMNISIHDNSIHESINSMIKTVKELIESNDRLTKALIEAYSDADPDYNADVPQPVYMDGTKVK